MNRHHRALQLIAEARPALLDHAPDRPAPALPDQSAPMRSAAGHASRRLFLAGLVPTVAVAVVAGVAVIVSTSNPPAESPPTARSNAPAQPVTARGILLAAAEKTATAVPATEGYWVTKIELDHVYDVGDYHVLGRSEVETWYSLRSGGDVVSVVRWLGAAPATDADKVACRAAGSPTTWSLTGPEGKQSGGRDLPAAPSPRKVSTVPGVSFDIGGSLLTFAQVRALPTDPDKLKAYLVKLDDAAGKDGNWTPDEIAKWRVEMLFTQSWTLLSQLPVPPAVRAAPYRMLAGLPGLTVTENVRDARNRTGAGISYAYRNADGSSVETRLVIDPDSGSLLAHEHKSDASLLLDARFSDAAPPRS
ncbi:CU044_5270 family protein [Plantactinospora solaniradicis]|uniref:CU044_5270 family protein n=1 Tax=Plantactinospora solaniradicis TaxID=1723736 RepID=A0ABW1K9Z2_9ACTN